MIAFFKTIFRVAIFCVAVAGIGLAAVKGLSYGRELFSGNNIVTSVDYTRSQMVEISIPQGASTEAIANILKNNGLIDDTLLFRIKSRLEGNDEMYKHGLHYVPIGHDMFNIMEILKKGATNENQVRVTIPEGYTAKQIAALLEENELVTANEFLVEANNTNHTYEFLEILPKVPERTYALEGYLFPETYFFEKGSSAYEIVDQFLYMYNKVYVDEIKKLKENTTFNLDNIMIIASIIEAEIVHDDERRLASSVIYNRLNVDMPLQMCSSVLYALGIRRENLSLTDLEVVSPYNTYTNKGLPIGPVSNPGIEAIRAAISPPDTNYMFFVLKEGNEGAHEFTETYEDFLTAKEKYKQQF